MNNPPGFYLIGPIYPARIGPFLPTNVGPFFPTLTQDGRINSGILDALHKQRVFLQA